MERRPQVFTRNQEKMHELIQYISQQCASQDNYGKTKLCKTLFYADSLSFAHLGKPITGWSYIKMPYGPYPDNIESEFVSMISEGQLQIQVAGGYPFSPKQKPVNLREPDLDMFSPQEISVIDYVIRRIEDLSGTHLSNISHSGAWKFAGDGEEIPYESFYLDVSPLTAEEHIRGLEVAAEHDLFA